MSLLSRGGLLLIFDTYQLPYRGWTQRPWKAILGATRSKIRVYDIILPGIGGAGGGNCNVTGGYLIFEVGAVTGAPVFPWKTLTNLEKFVQV
jgi:hypothetical protein